MGNRWKVYIVSFLVLLCVSCNPKGRIDENDIYKKIEKYENGILVNIESYDKAGFLREKKFFDKNGVPTSRSVYFYNKTNGLQERILSFGLEDKFLCEYKFFYSNKNLEIEYSATNVDGYVLTISKRYDKEDRLISEFQGDGSKITRVKIYNYDTAHNLYTTQTQRHYIKHDPKDFPEIDVQSPICYKLDSLNQILSIIGEGKSSHRLLCF